MTIMSFEEYKSPKVIVALDYQNENDALKMAKILSPDICNLKVGLELFINCGPSIIKKLHNLDYKIFLDLKLHDINNTVSKSIGVIRNLGVWMTNVHASGGDSMMMDAVEELKKNDSNIILLGVTVLTSLNNEKFKKIGFSRDVKDQVLHMASMCHRSKLNGIVCSAKEAKIIKKSLPSDFICVCPGIRTKQNLNNDQERIMTPKEAAENGADYIVVGRPITQSNDPLGSLKRIKEEFETNVIK